VDFIAVCDYFFDQGGHGVAGGEVGGVDFGFAAEFLDFLTGGLVGFVALRGWLEGKWRGGDEGCGTWTRRMSAPASARAMAIA
jgi:hypothetical protein